VHSLVKRIVGNINGEKLQILGAGC
jgi:hypothetical protein